ncbi:hypothetical protein FHR93_005307 [Geodermatophilus sabuli]|uniref:Uncharacterized protein n=1 Tax=Geodermatophilus sabuli TaxID=1564158 RepID=A0A285EMJ6_9ACTN|nr:hypothetical protein [Geodermatophilus sabuli]SNX99404.1 hypothetical protein SAMN06893097_1202 [Geodermatophilus sabuli]
MFTRVGDLHREVPEITSECHNRAADGCVGTGGSGADTHSEGAALTHCEMSCSKG